MWGTLLELQGVWGWIMGHVWVEARLVNPINDAELKTRALVDTGATYTVVPWSIYEKLNLIIVGKKTVETAKGPKELDESFLVIEIKGKKAVTPVLISRDLKDVLVGVLTLEALGLAVDPTTGELKESRILLLQTSNLEHYT
jgi:clan AA aspartic protease